MHTIKRSHCMKAGPVTADLVGVPTGDEFVPDDAIDQCMICGLPWTVMFRRRHHCRMCKRLVCGICSQERLPLTGVPSSSMFASISETHGTSNEDVSAPKDVT